MSINKIIGILIITFLSHASYADAVMFGGGLGQAHFEVDSDYSFTGSSEDASNGAIEAFGGIQFDNNLYTILQLSFYPDTDAHEGDYDYNFRTSSFALGYRLKLSERFDLRPQLELANRALRVENDRGGEVSENSNTYVGGAISIDLKFTRRLAMYGTYRFERSDFITGHTTMLGLRFNLDFGS